MATPALRRSQLVCFWGLWRAHQSALDCREAPRVSIDALQEAGAEHVRIEQGSRVQLAVEDLRQTARCVLWSVGQR